MTEDERLVSAARDYITGGPCFTPLTKEQAEKFITLNPGMVQKLMDEVYPPPDPVKVTKEKMLALMRQLSNVAQPSPPGKKPPLIPGVRRPPKLPRQISGKIRYGK